MTPHEAADGSIEHGFQMSDSLICATSLRYGAELYTGDEDLHKLKFAGFSQESALKVIDGAAHPIFSFKVELFAADCHDFLMNLTSPTFIIQLEIHESDSADPQISLYAVRRCELVYDFPIESSLNISLTEASVMCSSCSVTSCTCAHRTTGLGKCSGSGCDCGYGNSCGCCGHSTS
jgi:hypothetical protein